MIGHKWTLPALKYPRLIIAVMTTLTLALGLMIPRITVDTNPENMLAADEPVRLFHNEVKREFSLHDVVVLGVVNERHPDGVFNPESLTRILALSRFAQELSDPDNPERRVVRRYVIAPDTVDSIEQDGPGQIRFEWLMPTAPTSREEALAVRDRALGNPLLRGTMVSEDGQALAIYLPISSKEYAYQVRRALLDKIAEFGPVDDQYHITGLPVAEDTFGVEMFTQMAVSAPLAMVAIFLLMLYFFRKVKMIIAPMIVALLTVIATMGMLIGTGYTVHIMSSMIPIFLMPITVVASIHILSAFFDKYQESRDRVRTLKEVMDNLFTPILYTSITSAAGFASLALTPIPPVRIFGLFVAFGIMLAWVLTVLFIPAYIMLLKESTLADFGVKGPDRQRQEKVSALDRHLNWLGGFTFKYFRLILILTVVTLGVAALGISRITVNDNPVKWFTEKHPIREADRVLNHHFAGTYEAFLVLESTDQQLSPAAAAQLLGQTLREAGIGPEEKVWAEQAAAEAVAVAAAGDDLEGFFQELETRWEDQLFAAADDVAYDFWATAMNHLVALQGRGEVFKQPEMLQWLIELEEHLIRGGTVGKSNSVTSLVRKVYQELLGGAPGDYRLPESAAGVAQTMMAFQNSHKPDDLWHLVTPDFRKANLWLQLREGDNQVMEQTLADLERFLAVNPPPTALEHHWAGQTYINVVWQQKMVYGMLWAFLGSFVVVYLLMTLLFRSPLWGLLAMIPMTVTIAFIYGLIGFVGKDYDMPVAVLSSLTLGLAVDFAIHFLQRSRMAYDRLGSWLLAKEEIFAEPSRAITRNVIVVSVGFVPLLAAPLVPYKTVGFFIAAILAVSGLATMFMLPATLRLLERRLFKPVRVRGQES
ncbi:MAG TPA: RND transporter [Desulfurivibrio alkaliphilus]|uniref:RND transporter n=1 Tax=Desulfurivibrio alkaliphilus TaxID=427923 RepID=A0A7C2TGY8_9BACT|nr:RND transporter [Desulfurivibrio alkaliphilus]